MGIMVFGSVIALYADVLIVHCTMAVVSYIFAKMAAYALNVVRG